MWSYIICLVGNKHKKMCVRKTRLLVLDKKIRRCLVDMKNGKCSVGYILAEEETEDKLKALVSERKLHLWKYYSTLLPVEIQLSLKNAEPLLESDMETKNWKKRLMTLAFQESEFCKSPSSERITSPIHEYMTSPNEVLNDKLPIEEMVPLLKKGNERSTSFDRTKIVQPDVYIPELHSKIRKDIPQNNDANETMNVFKNSTIDNLSSNAPSISSTENTLVAKRTEMAKKNTYTDRYYSSGVRYELFQLRNDLQLFKQQVITLLERNHDTLQGCYKDLEILKQNKIFTVQETVKNALPSKSLDDFLRINNILSKSMPHREELKKLYNELIRGDTNIGSCIQKIMKSTLSSAVQSEYFGERKKFHGVTKLDYNETQTFQCLKEVLIQQFGFISEVETMSACIGKWLSSDADHEGVRNKKSRKLLNNPSN